MHQPEFSQKNTRPYNSSKTSKIGKESVSTDSDSNVFSNAPSFALTQADNAFGQNTDYSIPISKTDIEKNCPQTDEKPYSCEFCPKKFVQKVNLTYHRRSHTGEKPYSCDFCSKSFARNCSLTKHKQTHIKVKFEPIILKEELEI